MKLNIPLILGTSRKNRRSKNVANFILNLLNQHEEIESFIVDPRDFNMPFDGNNEEHKDPKYTEITKNADGFFIVVPEYNHTFSGSLKRLLDSEYNNYHYKPVAYAGVSDGPWGGVRAIEALINATKAMGLISCFKDVQFPYADKIFNENAELIKDKEDLTSRTNYLINELVWLAKTLKYGRENIQK